LLVAPIGAGILVSAGEGVIHYLPAGAQEVLEHDNGARGDATAVASDGAGGFYLARDGRLAAIHGSEVVAEARSLGFYGGWHVIIDENGSWRFLGANAP